MNQILRCSINLANIRWMIVRKVFRNTVIDWKLTKYKYEEPIFSGDIDTILESVGISTSTFVEGSESAYKTLCNHTQLRS